jgi:hypothetical protein
MHRIYGRNYAVYRLQTTQLPWTPLTMSTALHSTPTTLSAYTVLVSADIIADWSPPTLPAYCVASVRRAMSDRPTAQQYHEMTRKCLLYMCLPTVGRDRSEQTLPRYAGVTCDLAGSFGSIYIALADVRGVPNQCVVCVRTMQRSPTTDYCMRRLKVYCRRACRHCVRVCSGLPTSSSAPHTFTALCMYFGDADTLVMCARLVRLQFTTIFASCRARC